MILSEIEIDKAIKDLSAEFGNDRDKYFGLLYLEGMFALPRERCVKYIAFEANDYGIDGFYCDKQTNNLYLYQFKLTNNHKKFEESIRNLIDYGIEAIFTIIQQKSHAKDQFLIQLASSINEYFSVIKKVYIHFVFIGSPQVAGQSLLLEKLFEDLENKRHLIEDYFGHEIKFNLAFINGHTGILGLDRRIDKTYSYHVQIPKMLMHHGPNGEKLYLSLMKLSQLLEMYNEMGSRFLDRNIRSALPSTENVNEALYDSFEKIYDGVDHPSVFLFYHNGTTLFVEKIEENNDGYRIVEPRLLNGAQTISTYRKFVLDLNGKIDKKIEDQILVPCKIINNATNEFVTQVTINNNRQNPVEPWNLRAHDEIQLKLHDKFKSELGIYYERQENAWETFQENEDEIAEYVETNKCLELVTLAKTYLASDGKISSISSMRHVFENDELYSDIFNERRLSTDSKKIVMCYKIQFRLRKLANEIIAKGADRYHFMMRARNLLWALLCQAVLNDQKIREYSEEFGIDLRVQDDYSSYLKEMATSRCRPMIGALIDLEENREKVAAGKWSFLSQNKAYKYCMQIAKDRWDWEDVRLKK